MNREDIPTLALSRSGKVNNGIVILSARYPELPLFVQVYYSILKQRFAIFLERMSKSLQRKRNHESVHLDDVGFQPFWLHDS